MCNPFYSIVGARLLGVTDNPVSVYHFSGLLNILVQFRTICANGRITLKQTIMASTVVTECCAFFFFYFIIFYIYSEEHLNQIMTSLIFVRRKLQTVYLPMHFCSFVNLFLYKPGQRLVLNYSRVLTYIFSRWVRHSLLFSLTNECPNRRADRFSTPKSTVAPRAVTRKVLQKNIKLQQG